MIFFLLSFVGFSVGFLSFRIPLLGIEIWAASGENGMELDSTHFIYKCTNREKSITCVQSRSRWLRASVCVCLCASVHACMSVIFRIGWCVENWEKHTFQLCSIFRHFHIKFSRIECFAATKPHWTHFNFIRISSFRKWIQTKRTH